VPNQMGTVRESKSSLKVAVGTDTHVAKAFDLLIEKRRCVEYGNHTLPRAPWDATA
jgi:hypothetical protein